MITDTYRSRKSQKSGFTLVELLVVIAIISVLMGMLLPALENASIAAKSISCKNNMKQIGILQQLYSDDNNDWLCISCIVSTSRLWYSAIGNGTPMAGLVTCPSESLPPFGSDSTVAFKYSHYSQNCYLTGSNDGGGSYSWFRRRGAVRNPAVAIHFVDNPRTTTYITDGAWWVSYRHGLDDMPINDMGATMHSNSPGNVAFLDGHVKGLFYWELSLDYNFNSALNEGKRLTP